MNAGASDRMCNISSGLSPSGDRFGVLIIVTVKKEFVPFIGNGFCSCNISAVFFFLPILFSLT